jgi:uncharacterized protein YbjT (DUF2867 family)
VGDLTDLADVRAAVDGVERASPAYPVAPGTLTASTVLAEAATEAGVEAVVDTSQWTARPDHPGPATRGHWLTERTLDRAGPAVTHLRPPWFADNYLGAVPLVAGTGRLPLPLGDGRNASPSNSGPRSGIYRLDSDKYR